MLTRETLSQVLGRREGLSPSPLEPGPLPLIPVIEPDTRTRIVVARMSETDDRKIMLTANLIG